MKRNIRLILALVFVGVISISAVLLVRKAASGLQADLTDDNLYTLSDGTRNILGRVNEPITLKLYYSRTAVMTGPDQIRFWNNYYLYVRDLLDEYVRISKGNIKLEVIDPRKFSIEEEEAIRNGISGFEMSKDENFYFGLLATTELGRDEVIPFFEHTRQELVEYDVSKIIASLTQSKKSKLGVISSLPVMGQSDMPPHVRRMMQMQGQRPQPAWTIIRQLQMSYEVQSIRPGEHKVPDDINLLMVIHPKGLDQKLIFAIDQFVMRGGKLMVFVDPNCMVDTPPPNPRNPYAEFSHPSGSDLNNLLVNWGAVVYTKKVTIDRATATKGGYGSRMPPMFLWLNDECVNKSHPVVAELNGLRMRFAGAIGRHGGTATFTPLISTTETGTTWTPADTMSMKRPDMEKIRKEVPDGTEAITLACMLEGPMRSIFPNGIDIPDDSPPPATTQPAASQPKDNTKRLEAIKSIEKGTVMVVSDVDILTDGLAYRRFGRIMAQDGANAPFVMNALEFLSGSDDLISVRSRGRFIRPFTVVDKIERETDERMRTKIEAANAERQGYLEELEALSQKGENEKFLERGRELNAAVAAVNRKLNDIRGIGRDEIEALEFRFKIYNVVVAPAILLLIAAALWLFRYFRAKHYAGQRA